MEAARQSARNPEPAPRVAIIDEDARFARYLCATLQAAGYKCAVFSSFSAIAGPIEQLGAQAVLLDLAAPELKRLEAIARIRAVSVVPILVLSARADEADKVSALDAGADDYLTKPVASGELLARLRVAERHGRARRHSSGERVTSGDLTVDLLTREVSVGGTRLSLTPTDYKLLALLARNIGRVVPREQLLQEGWGPQAHDPHYLRVYMARLRRKLDPRRAGVRFITTETGIGYRLLTVPKARGTPSAQAADSAEM
jgi:two-component system KDP operon response regulator KdpE